jgi:diadenosine tetraphosphate (Ap4A) HIT family hydrolase
MTEDIKEERPCPFCSADDRILKENDLALVILSDPHKVPGHFLVMPKRHIDKPWDLTHEELTAVFDLIFFIEQKVIGKLGDGVDIRQNYRPFNELGVRHVVFHVLPRSKDDYLYKVSEQYEKDLYVDLDDMERDAVADILKG